MCGTKISQGMFDAYEKFFSECFNKFYVHSFIISNIRPFALREVEGGGGLKIKIQKTNCIQKSIKIEKKLF
jgi:hypothetical protein